MIAGIPDLRAFEVDWLDYRDDRAEAQRLAERFTTADVGGIEALVTHVLSETNIFYEQAGALVFYLLHRAGLTSGRA